MGVNLPCWSTMCRCFVMNVVPHNLIVNPSRNRLTNGEDEFSQESFLQQFQYLSTLIVIWQVGIPTYTRVRKARVGMFILTRERFYVITACSVP